MRFSLKPLTARLRALSQESQDFYWDGRYYRIENAGSFSSKSVFFSLQPYIARIRAITTGSETFAERKFIKDTRSAKNNTPKPRHSIPIKKDCSFTQKMWGTTVTWTLKEGTSIDEVKSIARGIGIDNVQKLIDKLKKEKNAVSISKDWEKLKGNVLPILMKRHILLKYIFIVVKITVAQISR